MITLQPMQPPSPPAKKIKGVPRSSLLFTPFTRHLISRTTYIIMQQQMHPEQVLETTREKQINAFESQHKDPDSP